MFEKDLQRAELFLSQLFFFFWRGVGWGKFQLYPIYDLRNPGFSHHGVRKKSVCFLGYVVGRIEND